jgi:RimJ/RimL family protein N-acetyltransferase
MPLTHRRLEPGEEALIEAFLAGTPGTTLFLRSNLARAGLAGDGRPFSGVYAGAFDDGALAGIAAHFWNDNVVLAPGPHAETLAALAVSLTGRRVAGILGPHAEVVRTRSALGLGETPARFSSKELLYSIACGELCVPPALVSGELVVRLPEPDELDELLAWRMQYCAETAATPDTPETRADQRRYLEAYQEKQHHFVVTRGHGGERVAYSAFNATVADLVQVGGVWTPPSLRGHGYARCVVAGSLQHARNRGVRGAILFTDEKNVAAQRSYVAVGFRPIGDYGIVFFANG